MDLPLIFHGFGQGVIIFSIEIPQMADMDIAT